MLEVVELRGGVVVFVLLLARVGLVLVWGLVGCRWGSRCLCSRCWQPFYSPASTVFLWVLWSDPSLVPIFRLVCLRVR